MSGITQRTLACWAGIFFAITIARADVIEPDIKLDAKPDHIEIETFYGGADIQVQAEFPVCDAVVLELEGEETEEVLNLKGRVIVLWMNVAEIKVEHAPQIYIIKTSSSLAETACEDTLELWDIGIPSLRKIVQFTSDKPLSGKEFAEFLKLKMSKGIYRIQEYTLQIMPAGKTREQISTTLKLPPVAPEGHYQLTLFCFRDGSLMGKTSTEITIEKTGLPLFMSTLAFQHAALYGIVAIIVAMIAGLLMGLIFSKGKGAH